MEAARGEEAKTAAAICIQRVYRAWRQRRGRSLCTNADGIDATTDVETSSVTTPALCVNWERKLDCESTRRDSSQSDAGSQVARRQKTERILQMLKQAERQNAEVLTAVQTAGAFPSRTQPSAMPTSKQAETVLEKFRKKIEELRQSIRERDNAIEKLQNETKHQKELHRVETQNAVQIERARSEQQQRLHDADLEKRLKFIDSLLHDKDNWVKQCEKLTHDLKARSVNAQENHASQLEALKERLAVELRKQKQDWNRKETAKREKWMQEQREEILQTAAKAVEPKLAEMTEQYKSETRRLREKIATQEKLLAQSEEHAMQQRQRLIQEREDGVEKERLRAHTQLIGEKEKWAIQSEAAKDTLRRQWMEERNRLTRELEETQIQHESTSLEQQAANDRALQLLERKHAHAVEELGLSHQRAVEEVKKQCGTERIEWRDTTRQELQHEMTRELLKARTQLERERDAEIEVVVHRFEEEKEKLESDLRKRIVQLQHEKEKLLESLDDKNAHLHQRAAEVSELKERLDDQITTREEAMGIKETELEEYRKLHTALQREFEELKLQMRSEEERHNEAVAMNESAFHERFRDAEDTNADLQNTIAQLQHEMGDLKKGHHEELEALELHVKEALDLKDKFIDSLKQQVSSKAAELQSMNQLLRHQDQSLDACRV